MIKTVNLSANTEVSVKELGGDKVRIRNFSSGSVYISNHPNVVPYDEDVLTVMPGSGDYFICPGDLYIKSEQDGMVELTGDFYYRPFAQNIYEPAVLSNKIVSYAGKAITIDISGNGALIAVKNSSTGVYVSTVPNVDITDTNVSYIPACNTNDKRYLYVPCSGGKLYVLKDSENCSLKILSGYNLFKITNWAI
ncbi:MAG: hypothetical protein ACI4J1_10665 [Ruminiclostridium sp.]